jgi:uncharacterized heparinase superfamily protein
LGTGAAREILVDRACATGVQQTLTPDGHHLTLSHDGWAMTHGLVHRRALTLSTDGRRLAGSEFLGPVSGPEQERFEQLLSHGKLEGVSFSIRFHLHPDVDARLDMGGTAVSLALKSGEMWVFRQESRARLGLEPSVYLEKGRLRPRASRQIILTGRANTVQTLVGWTLAKAQDTPLAIRDLDRDDPPAVF